MVLQPQPTRELENVLGQFSDEQLKLIMSNVGAIQLTDGCTLGCSFCGFEALKGVRSYIPPSLLEDLASRFSNELWETGPFLYYASDPFDYDFEGSNYWDIHQMWTEKVGYSPFISTAVPQGKEKLVLDLLQKPDPERKRYLKKMLSTLPLNEHNKKIGRYRIGRTLIGEYADDTRYIGPVVVDVKNIDWQDPGVGLGHGEDNSCIDIGSIFATTMLEFDRIHYWQNSVIDRISESVVNRKRLSQFVSEALFF